MPTQTMLGREIHVDDEGFLTEFDEWDEALGAELAKQIDIEMTPRHWEIVASFAPTSRRRAQRRPRVAVDTTGGFPVKEQFALFPKKPAKKMAYVAGSPSPTAAFRPERTPPWPTTNRSSQVRRRHIGPQACHYLLEGQPRYGLPWAHPRVTPPSGGYRGAPVLHVLGLRHDS